MTGLVESLETVTAWGQPVRLALALVVKSSLILTLALAAYAALSRASAATRHLVLLTGLAAAIVLPVAQLVAPPLTLELLPAPKAEGAVEAGAAPWTEIGPASSPESGPGARALGPSGEASAPRGKTSPAGAQTPTESSSPSPVALGGLISGVVSLLLVAYLALGILRVRFLRRRSVELTEDSTWGPLLRRLRERLGIPGRVSLWESPRVRVPLTLGVLRPEVVLPTEASDWTEGERRAVLLHELAHVKRRDWLAQIVARIVCSLYWFNPLAWIATGRMLVEAERACDDVVVTGGEGGSGYARQLLEMATRRRRELPTFGAVAMARRATLSRRIQAILDPSQRRSTPGRLQVASVLGVALALLLFVGPARIVRAEAPPPPSDLPGDPDPEWQLESELDSESELDRIAELEKLESVEGEIELDADAESNTGRDTETEADFDGELDRSYDGAPPLLAAVARGDRPAVRRLLAEGANPNQGATELGTPLILAAAMGDTETVRILLDGGAAPDLAQMLRERWPQLPRSPLGAAAWSGNSEIVDLLLGAGASPDFVPEGDASSLMIAARHGHGEIVERLLAEGADPNRVVPGDGSPLIAAVRGGEREIVEALLVARADVDRWVDGDESPLFHAVSSGRADLVRLLLEAGADPDVRWGGDGTPLIVASRHGHERIVDLLLSHGARADLGVEGDGNALISAARSGAVGLLREFLDRGADPNAVVRGDGSPLIAAAAMDHLSAVRLLVERGADVDQVVPGDETALIQAAARGHYDVVEYLLDAGADPNLAVRVRTGRNRTEIRSPLGEALENGHRGVARLLRSRGASETGSPGSSRTDRSGNPNVDRETFFEPES